MNNWLAVNVMGWNNDNGQFWEDKDGHFKYYFTLVDATIYEGECWHPDTDPGQALMCADKAFGKGWTIHISFYAHKLQIFHGGRVVSLWEFEDMKGLSRAICEAIAEAVEK